MEDTWATVAYRFWTAWSNGAAFRLVASGLGALLALTAAYSAAEVVRLVRPGGRVEQCSAGLFLAWALALEALLALLAVLFLIGGSAAG